MRAARRAKGTLPTAVMTAALHTAGGAAATGGFGLATANGAGFGAPTGAGSGGARCGAAGLGAAYSR